MLRGPRAGRPPGYGGAHSAVRAAGVASCSRCTANYPFPKDSFGGTIPALNPGMNTRYVALAAVVLSLGVVADASAQQSGTGSSGAATPIDPNLASVATVPLMAYAQQEAPNMGRDGNLVAGNFLEGQTLEQPFTLSPGKCYTVLAVGAGMSQVDLSIVAVTPLPQGSGVLATARGTSNASLGGRGSCYKWDFPVAINAKYVVRATHGRGLAAAQLYSK